LRVLGAVSKVAWGIMKDQFKAAWGYLKSGLLALKGLVKIVSGVFTGDWRKAWSGVKDLFRGSVGIVLNVMRGMTAPMRAVTKLVAKGIASAFEWGWSKVENIFKGGANAVISVVNKIIDALNWAIPNKLGWGKLSIDIADNPIPHVALANGGVTTGPMMALIGDNPGGREAVIPLDKYNLGGNVNLYVEVAPFTNPVEVGRQIVKALDAYRGTGGAVPV